MNGIYNKNSVLDFGEYKGYELAWIHVAIPAYIYWCINYLDCFHISDLCELEKFHVLSRKSRLKSDKWGYGLPFWDMYENMLELNKYVEIGNETFVYDSFTHEKNNKNYQIIKNNNFVIDVENIDNIDVGYSNFLDDWNWGSSGSSYDSYDMRTEGQKRNLCEGGNCYECSYADQCF